MYTSMKDSWKAGIPIAIALFLVGGFALVKPHSVEVPIGAPSTNLTPQTMSLRSADNALVVIPQATANVDDLATAFELEVSNEATIVGQTDEERAIASQDSEDFTSLIPTTEENNEIIQ